MLSLGFFSATRLGLEKILNIQCDEQSNLLISSDQGDHWIPLKLKNERKQPYCFTPFGNTVYVGAAGGFTYSDVRGPVLHWTDLKLPFSTYNSIVTGLNGPIIVNRSSGFLRCDAAIGLCSEIKMDIHGNNILSVLETKNKGTLVSTEGGIYRRANGEKEWTQPHSKRSSNVVEAGNALLSIGREGIWRSADSGVHWQNVLNNGEEFSYLYHGKERLYAISTPMNSGWVKMQGTLYYSDDEGLHWNPWQHTIPKELNGINSVAENGDYLFAVTQEGLFRSADQGNNWKQVYQIDKESGNSIQLKTESGRVYILLFKGC